MDFVERAVSHSRNTCLHVCGVSPCLFRIPFGIRGHSVVKMNKYTISQPAGCVFLCLSPTHTHKLYQWEKKTEGTWKYIISHTPVLYVTQPGRYHCCVSTNYSESMLEFVVTGWYCRSLLLICLPAWLHTWLICILFFYQLEEVNALWLTWPKVRKKSVLPALKCEVSECFGTCSCIDTCMHVVLNSIWVAYSGC